MSKTLFKTKGQWNYKVTSWTNRIPSSITISQEHTDPFTRKQFPDSRSIARLQPSDETLIDITVLMKLLLTQS
jgi:hypothetical protein